MSYDTRLDRWTSKKSKQVMAKGRENLIKQIKAKDELLKQYKDKLSDNSDNE